MSSTIILDNKLESTFCFYSWNKCWHVFNWNLHQNLHPFPLADTTRIRWAKLYMLLLNLDKGELHASGWTIWYIVLFSGKPHSFPCGGSRRWLVCLLLSIHSERICYFLCYCLRYFCLFSFKGWDFLGNCWIICLCSMHAPLFSFSVYSLLHGRKNCFLVLIGVKTELTE